MSRSEFVGVDGCRGGWFSVGLGLGNFETEVFCTFSELLDYYGDAKLILIDIPIGLPEGQGGRDCDREAREKLGRPRASSVFPTPTRQAVQQALREPEDHKSAVRVEQEVAGKGIGIQTFNIAPKMAGVDEVMRTRGANAKPVVREVHPELLFWALNGGKPMESSKKGKLGRDERLCVLLGTEPRAHRICDIACLKFRRNVVARDDILDALAAAVAAYHHHDRLKTLPECPPNDAKGLRMEIVYPASRRLDITKEPM